MARGEASEDRRRQLLPVVAQVFAQLGYRRATTAELAARCQVRENVLYRLWPDKKAMFLAAIDYVYSKSAEIWGRLLAEGDGRSAARRLLDYEARHHGEFGLYRIVFAGLSETDDPDIRAALGRMYRRYHRFLVSQISAARGGQRGRIEAALAAWAVIGLGTVANIGRELDLLGSQQRAALLRQAGELLLEEPDD